MKFIRISSDIHLESLYGTPATKLVDNFIPADERDSESVLVLAGDISSKPDQAAQFIKQLEDRFIKVIYVFGNHEHYHHVYNDLPDQMFEQFRKCGVQNTLCPGNDVKSFIVDGVKFIAGTLWGECSHRPDYNEDIQRGIADFRYIRVREYGRDDYHMTPAYMRRLSGEHRQLIRTELARADEDKVIVVTHHLPTYDAVSLRYRVSTLNGAFVCPLDDVWDPNSNPTMFIHGHTHDHQDFVKDGIRFVANPVGYRSEWGNPYNKHISNHFIEI
jgi:predicted MPP superfamily phosphohydrolase